MTALERAYWGVLDTMRELARRGRAALLVVRAAVGRVVLWLIAKTRDLRRRARPAWFATRRALARGRWRAGGAVHALRWRLKPVLASARRELRHVGRRGAPAMLTARRELRRRSARGLGAARALPLRNPIVLGAIAGAAVSFGVCFAVVAGATRSSAPQRTAERPKSDPAAIRLGLGPVAALRVREGLLPPAVTTAASRTPPKPPAPAPTTTAPGLAAPPTQTQPTPLQAQPTQPTPKQAAPKPKPRPAKPAPKAPQGPDFDDTGPQSPPGGSG